ncbi:MAG: cyclase [Intrasporangiaceae bacterium]|nr:cyclase [Intrasporangiaceae bacterium]
MGEISVESTVRIGCSTNEVMAVLHDIAGQHEWWPGQYLSEPLQTDDEGRVTRSRIGNDVKIAKDEFEVAYTHDPSGAGYSWVLVEASTLQRAQVGSWEVRPHGDESEVTLRLMVDSTLPLPGFLLKKTLQDTVNGATKGLRRRCES